MCSYVHCSIIYNSQDSVTTQAAINGWKHKDVVCVCVCVCVCVYGFLGGSDGKESACSVRRLGFDP